jgi:neurofibromin 1
VIFSPLGLGYNEDLKTRTSFMEVLTSILQQGAEFNSLADTALGDRYNRMLDLITTKTPEGDFPIMMALVNSTPPENMVRVCSLMHMHDCFVLETPLHVHV